MDQQNLHDVKKPSDKFFPPLLTSSPQQPKKQLQQPQLQQQPQHAAISSSLMSSPPPSAQGAPCRSRDSPNIYHSSSGGSSSCVTSPLCQLQQVQQQQQQPAHFTFQMSGPTSATSNPFLISSPTNFVATSTTTTSTFTAATSVATTLSTTATSPLNQFIFSAQSPPTTSTTSSFAKFRPSTTSTTTSATTSSIKPHHRRPHHSGGSKLPSLWKPPFERTWSVPEQSGPPPAASTNSTNISTPTSKRSSSGTPSIEQIISKEEALALSKNQRKLPHRQQSVVIEKPIRSFGKAPSLDRGSKEFLVGSKEHLSFHTKQHQSNHQHQQHHQHHKEVVAEDFKYLEDPLVDLSLSPPTTAKSTAYVTATVGSHAVNINAASDATSNTSSISATPTLKTIPTSTTQHLPPPSYRQIHLDFGKGAFHPPPALPASHHINGNIYTNPSVYPHLPSHHPLHHQPQQQTHPLYNQQTKYQSHAGTPVEVKLTNYGSPVQFCPIGHSDLVTGSAGGISSFGWAGVRNRLVGACSSGGNGRSVTKATSCCSTQPNSPTSTRQRSSLFGKIRRFPSLKLQRHIPATSSNHVVQKNANNLQFNKQQQQQQHQQQQQQQQFQRRTKHRSTPSLPSNSPQPPVGPTITVTTHSEDDLNGTKSAPAECNSNYKRPSHLKSNVVHLGDDTSLFGTSKEQASPPPQPANNNFTGDHFKFNNNTNNNSNQNPTSASTYLRDQIISFFQPSDNKLAMKLFGNKNALMKEKLRQKAAGNWVIHPCSNFRFYWDLFMLVLLIANLIILPVAISFFNDDLSTKWIVFNGLSDTVFLLDLIINFRTGIIADNFADDIILEPRLIAKHYLKTWFFLDLISSIPLDYIILLFSPDQAINQLIHAGRALRIVRLVKLLSLLRLLRLSRLVRYVSQWEEDIGQFLTVASKFMRIVNLVCLILLLGHWNGCLQWLVPMIQEFPRDSWAALEELQSAHWTEQYTWALFKALSHMLCIGYGRYPPQSTTDVWLTTVSMLTGATCYALFVGHSTTLIQSFDTSRRLYREKFKQVEEYMIYRKLPRKLRQRITDYYEHRYQGKMFDEQSILAEVNECLREEIINFNCRALVASVPFFTHADPNFVSDIVTNLRHEMFQPGDYIIREGSVGTKVYFIQEGIVDIITQNGEVATSLSDGSYFGEICLLAKTKRTASVRAEAYCNLFSLSVEHFDNVLERYPLMRRTMESVAAERLNKIGKDPCILSNRDDLEADISMVNELIMRATPLPSSGSEDSDNNGHATDDDRKPQKKRKKKDRDDQGSNGGGGGKDTLTVKLATMLRRSRSNINMRQASKDEK